MPATQQTKTWLFHNSVSFTRANRGEMALPRHAGVAVGAPPEFRGDADVWGPEELLLGAVNSCLMLTFLGFARRRHLEIAGCESSAEGLVESVEGKYQVTRIVVKPVLTLRQAGDAALADEVLQAAKAACFLSNSVKAAVTLEPRFEASSAAALA